MSQWIWTIFERVFCSLCSNWSPSLIWFVNDRHTYLVNPVWFQSWCKHRSHWSVFMSWWVLGGCGNLRATVVCTQPLIFHHGVRGRDCHTGRMWLYWVVCRAVSWGEKENWRSQDRKEEGEVLNLVSISRSLPPQLLVLVYHLQLSYVVVPLVVTAPALLRKSTDTIS